MSKKLSFKNKIKLTSLNFWLGKALNNFQTYIGVGVWREAIKTPAFHFEPRCVGLSPTSFSKSDFLLMYTLRGRRKRLKYLGPCQHVEDPGGAASRDQPFLSCCGHWGNEAADGSSISLSTSQIHANHFKKQLTVASSDPEAKASPLG